MKNSQYRLSKLKYQLEGQRRKGKSFVVWRLNEEQLEYVTRSLKYQVIPYYYWVQTRQLQNYRMVKDPLLKELHHQNKRGKKNIVKRLSPSQLDTLEGYHIKYGVAKYKVNLQ